MGHSTGILVAIIYFILQFFLLSCHFVDRDVSHPGVELQYLVQSFQNVSDRHCWKISPFV